MNEKLLVRFFKEKVVIHVSTLDEYNGLMDWLQDNTSIRWVDGVNPTEKSDFSNYQIDDTINANKGEYLTHISIRLCLREGYEVIDFKELIKDEEKEEVNKKLLMSFMMKKVAVHTETEEEYNKFLKILEDETWVKWPFGRKPTEESDLYNPTPWEVWKEETCLNCYGGWLVYGPKFQHEEQGCKIIEFKDLIKKERK